MKDLDAEYENIQFNDVLFQIPQICHFVLLCAVPLGLSGIPVYELERSFLMPRESIALQRVMTSLLSTPFQRTRSAFTTSDFQQ